MVDLWFFLVALRCPLAVFRDLGRNFLTALVVRPGHVEKKFLLMALVHVETEGLNAAQCKKNIKSSLLFCSYALFA